MTSNLDGERTDILAGLASARYFLRFAARDLTDEQARQRTTASELTLGGLIKHVAGIEQGWATFTLEGPSALGNFDDMSEADMARWADQFKLLPDETLAGVLADYEKVAQRAGELGQLNLLGLLDEEDLRNVVAVGGQLPGDHRDQRSAGLEQGGRPGEHLAADQVEHHVSREP